MRIAATVILTNEQRAKLEAYARGRRAPARVVLRARIALLAAEDRQGRNDPSTTVHFVALRQAPIEDRETESCLIHGDPRPATRLNGIECLVAPALIYGGCNRGRAQILIVAIHAEHKAARPRNESEGAHSASLPMES
jgi:hypothetical protein